MTAVTKGPASVPVPAGLAAVATLTGAAVLAGLVGVLVGSFLNVVIYRVPRGLSILRPGSSCPRCSAPVAWYDNVPLLSWVVLRGRCRHCGAPISVRYPVVEAATALVAAGTTVAAGAAWSTVGLCVLAVSMVPLVGIELDGLTPPPAIATTGTALGVVALGAAAAAGDGRTRIAWAIAGMAGAALVGLGATRLARRGGSAPAPTIPTALLPTGAVLGWLGGWAAVAGAATVLVVLAGAAAATARRREAPGGEPHPLPRGWGTVMARAGAGAVLVALVVTGSLR